MTFDLQIAGIIDPGRPREMPPRPLRAAARSELRFFASAVVGGILPSGGSVTIQARLFFGL